MIRLTVFAALALALCSCTNKPIRSESTGNPDVEAGLIAKIEGCRLYRVWTDARYVYVTVCGGSSGAQWDENCGKNCTRKQSNQTEYQ